MKAYTVAIPNLPLIPNRKVKKFIKYISTLDGLLGIHPHYPRGTLLIFNSENQAKIARNQIEHYEGYACGVGRNICEVEIDDVHAL